MKLELKIWFPTQKRPVERKEVDLKIEFDSLMPCKDYLFWNVITMYVVLFCLMFGRHTLPLVLWLWIIFWGLLIVELSVAVYRWMIALSLLKCCFIFWFFYVFCFSQYSLRCYNMVHFSLTGLFFIAFRCFYILQIFRSHGLILSSPFSPYMLSLIGDSHLFIFLSGSVVSFSAFGW